MSVSILSESPVGLNNGIGRPSPRQSRQQPKASKSKESKYSLDEPTDEYAISARSSDLSAKLSRQGPSGRAGPASQPPVAVASIAFAAANKTEVVHVEPTLTTITTKDTSFSSLVGVGGGSDEKTGGEGKAKSTGASMRGVYDGQVPSSSSRQVVEHKSRSDDEDEELRREEGGSGGSSEEEGERDHRPNSSPRRQGLFSPRHRGKLSVSPTPTLTETEKAEQAALKLRSVPKISKSSRAKSTPLHADTSSSPKDRTMSLDPALAQAFIEERRKVEAEMEALRRENEGLRQEQARDRETSAYISPPSTHRRRSTGEASARNFGDVPLTSRRRDSLDRRESVCELGAVTIANSTPIGASPSVGMTVNLPRILYEGGFLWKVPYHQTGAPKRRWFQLKPADGIPTNRRGRPVLMGDIEGSAGARGNSSHPIRVANPLVLIWLDPDRNLRKCPPREMPLMDVNTVWAGHKTAAFWQHVALHGTDTLPNPERCFSLVGAERTLDLAASSPDEARAWRSALSLVLFRMRSGDIATSTLPLGAPQQGIPHPPYNLSDVVPATARSAASSSGGTTAWNDGDAQGWRQHLFMAVRAGQLAQVCAAFAGGCPIDLMEAGTGDTALLAACRIGQVEIVRAALARGARNDPHPDFGQTALQAAVASGQDACARLILETAAPSKADVIITNHEDPNRESPIHVAVRLGNVAMTELLLVHGASLTRVDRYGQTPLHIAAKGGNSGVLACLIDAGGDALLEARDKKGSRPLHLAVINGKIDTVRLLLETAAEPNAPNGDGQTPYALACSHGYMAIAQLIREYVPAASEDWSSPRQLARSDSLPRPGGVSQGTGGFVSPVRHRGDTQSMVGRSSRGSNLYIATDQYSVTSPGGSAVTPAPQQWNTSYYQDRSGAQTARSSSSTPYWGTQQQQLAGGIGANSFRSTGGGGVTTTTRGSHGSLFDGLDVYVTSGRLPLGALGTPDTPPISGISSPASGYSVSPLAPSPGAGAPFFDFAHSQISARDQARMLHYAGAGVTAGSTTTATPNGCSSPLGTDRSSFTLTSTHSRLAWAEETAAHSCQPQQQSSTTSDAQYETFTLAGELWYICYNEDGYPYYLNEKTSISQWIDPRLPQPPDPSKEREPAGGVDDVSSVITVDELRIARQESTLEDLSER